MAEALEDVGDRLASPHARLVCIGLDAVVCAQVLLELPPLLTAAVSDKHCWDERFLCEAWHRGSRRLAFKELESALDHCPRGRLNGDSRAVRLETHREVCERAAAPKPDTVVRRRRRRLAIFREEFLVRVELPCFA